MTALFGGQKVSKASLRVQTYGEVDELNSIFGIVRLYSQLPLQTIQETLFVLGGELAASATDRLTAQDVQNLENLIDQASAILSPLQNFILPGGSTAAAYLHLARTVCRRTERSLVDLGNHESINPQSLIYLNRLSDLLFVWARLANHQAKIPDIIWSSK